MSFWQFLGRLAFSDKGETLQQVSDSTYVSSNGTTYTRLGDTTIGSDGTAYTQMGEASSDGSFRLDSGATGIGAVFNKRDDGFGARSRLGWDDEDDF